MIEHIEGLLSAAIRAAFPTVRVVTELPANLADVTPCARVTGIGGTGDRWQFDSPRIDVDVFDTSHDDKTARQNARDLAQQIRMWMLQQLPGQTLGTTGVLTVTEFMAPTWTPYDNTVDLRRFTFSMGLRLHDRSAA